MKRMNGGETVKGGYYWNLEKWEVATIQGEVGALPGGAEQKFVHLPLVALFLVVPVMGAAYAFSLPAIGFGVAVWGAAKKLGELGQKAMGEMAATVTPTWRPGEAYFAGKPQDEKKGEPAKDTNLDKLQKEIEEKRAEEEDKS